MPTTVAVAIMLLIGLGLAVADVKALRSTEVRAAKRDQALGSRKALTDAAMRERYLASPIDPELAVEVRILLARYADISSATLIHPDDPLASLAPFGWDEIGMDELTVELENRLHLRIPIRDYDVIATVDDLIALVSYHHAHPGFRGFSGRWLLSFPWKGRRARFLREVGAWRNTLKS